LRLSAMLDAYSRHTLLGVLRGVALAVVGFSLLMLLGWWVRMLQEGLCAGELLEGALWFLVFCGVMVVPAGIGLGVAQQVSRAVAGGELVALEAGGVGWQRVYRGVFVMGVVLAVLMFAAEETVVVAASARREAMMRSLAAQILRVADGENRLVEIPQAVIFCRQYRGGRAKGVVLFAWPKGYEVEATAKEARIEVSQNGEMVFLELRDARIWLRGAEQSDYIECQRYVVCRPLRLAEKERPQTGGLIRALELADETAQKAAKGNRRAALYHARYLTEAATRICLPFGAVVAVFLGLGVGRLFMRTGPVVALFATAVLFYIPIMTLMHLGKTGMAGVWKAMAVLVVADIVIGVALLRFARRPR